MEPTKPAGASAAGEGRPVPSPRDPLPPARRVDPLRARMAAKGAGPTVPSPKYDRFDKALAYMWKEMVTNAKGPEVQSIRNKLQMAEELRRQHPYPATYMGPGPADNSGGPVAMALAEFFALVHSGAPWDNKPKLDAMLRLKDPDGKPETKDSDYWFPVRGDTSGEYNYDIWSNIHFGFVGAAAGFDVQTLQLGAQTYGLVTGGNTKSDELSIKIGYELREKYGDNLTPENIRQAIVDHSKDYWALRPADGKGAGVSNTRNNE